MWEAVAGALRNPETLRQAVEAYEVSAGARDVELRSRVEHLQGQLRRVEKREARLLDLYEEADQTAPVSSSWRGSGATLAAALERAEGQATRHGSLNRLDALERLSAQARRGLDRLDDTGRRKLLGMIIDEVKVGSDRTLQIYGVLPDTVSILPWSRSEKLPGVGYLLTVSAARQK